MSSVSAALGQDGGGVAFEHEGRTYTASLVVQAHKAAFEKRVTSRAEAILERFRTLLPEKEYAEESLAFYREVRAGKYAFGGVVVDGALRGDDFTYFCSLLFGLPEDEMERLILSAGGKVSACVSHVIALSFPVARKAEGGEGKAEAGKATPPS